MSEQQIDDYALLREALLDIQSSAQWAEQAELLNVSAHLKQAAKKIRAFILTAPVKKTERQP